MRECHELYEWTHTSIELQRSGLNFTNILRAIFMLPDPKSTKKYSQAVSFFLCWDLRVKAARKSCA